MYRSGETTVREVIDGCLQRISSMDRTGPALNAITTINRAALADAAQLDQQLAHGRPPGPLFGVPVVIKDNIDVGGLPTTAGSAALVDLVPTVDAPVVAQLRTAGAIVVGKSNMSEFAFGTYDTESSVLEGPTRNPHQPRFATGGSSGGTAAAIAAQYCLAGLGTDTGCSIRSPASINGLVGLRPTHGLTTMAGIVPMNADWDTVGPLAGCVRDAALVLDVMQAIDPADERLAATPHLDTVDPSTLRIGVVRSLADGADTDAEVLDLFNRSLDHFEQLGVQIEDPVGDDIFTVPFVAGEWYRRFRADLDGYLAELGDQAPYADLEAILNSGNVHPRYRTTLQQLLSWPYQPDHHPQRRDMHDVQRRYTTGITDLMGQRGMAALVFPTFRYPPVENGSVPWTQPGETAPVGSNNYYASLTGFPALSAPIGRTTAGLPIGIQLLGLPRTERRLLQLAYAHEQSTGPAGRPTGRASGASTPVGQRAPA